MARYTGPQYRKSRRYGFSTLENGKDLAKKNSIPGQHGKDRQKKLSDYGEQLRDIVGVDGLIIEDSNPAERMAIAFNSNQIKI